ncbi:MAG: LacI family DNA-binding transcriptional regulator [Aminivibrio sp.]
MTFNGLMPRATMEDVARLAGVSKATVSRALKGDGRISPRTREKIWEVAREVGYRLDFVASSLSGGKTGIAAVVLDEAVPWLSGPLFLEGLNRVLSRAGMDLLLKLPGFRAGDLFSRLGARRVDVMLWAGSGDGAVPVPEGPLSAPLVTAGFSLPGHPAVLISPERTLERLRSCSAAGGAAYVGGEGPRLFPFLERLLQPRGDGDRQLPVFDGAGGDEIPGGAGFICSVQGGAPREGKYALEWPAFEFGAAAGRIMIKLLQGSSPIPRATYLIPALKSPGGESIPYIK